MHYLREELGILKEYLQNFDHIQKTSGDKHKTNEQQKELFAKLNNDLNKYEIMQQRFKLLITQSGIELTHVVEDQ